MAITKIEVPELFDFGSDNSAFKLPTGTTAERPTSPSNGEMRFNTTTGYVEYYDTTDAQWWKIDYEVLCTTNDPNYPITNLAYYKMSDASDSSGNAYNGTATNVNFNVAGKFGSAGSFNGSSSKVLPSSSPIPSSGAFTVSAWVKTSTSNTCFISFGDFWLKSEFSSGVFSLGDLNTSFQGTTDISDNVWHHIALSVDASNNIIMYVDGISEDTGTATISRTNGGAFAIGVARNSNPVYYWNGSIDQVRIFSSALNATQVTQLYEEIQCVPTIVPSDNFNTVLYTGDGTSSNAITGVGFEPNLTWIKDRSAAAGHWVNDSVRGAGKGLMTQSTGAEITSLPELMSSFDSDGFTVGYISNNTTNFLNNSYVAWSWKAGGAAVSNTDGTITSQVSANVDAGFSIVSYTGSGSASVTVGHGLNAAPEMYIIKSRGTGDWWVYNENLNGGVNPASYFLRLNLTNAESLNSGSPPSIFAGIEPTASVFSIGASLNVSSTNYVAYAFHSVDGFSKMGSYVGNLSSETNVVTGFEPSFVMVKCSVGFASGRWFMWDNKRSTSNIRQKVFFADLATAEQNNVVFGLNFNSNGFSIPTTTTSNSVNQTGYTYIFMAFAADPT